MSTIINQRPKLSVHTFGVYLADPVWLRHAGGPDPIMQTVYPKCSLLRCNDPATHERASQIQVCNEFYLVRVFFCDRHDPIEMLAASTMAVQNIGEEVK